MSKISKAIFYATSPIYFVFFPIIAQKKEKKEATSGTLLLASGIVFISSMVFTALYFIFPSLIIKIFFPLQEYQQLVPFLGFYSLYVSLFSFIFLLNSYFLSIGRTGVYKLNWIAAIFYVILLYMFHNTITSFIVVLTTSSLLLLISLLVYYKRRSEFI